MPTLCLHNNNTGTANSVPVENLSNFPMIGGNITWNAVGQNLTFNANGSNVTLELDQQIIFGPFTIHLHSNQCNIIGDNMDIEHQ